MNTTALILATVALTPAATDLSVRPGSLATWTGDGFYATPAAAQAMGRHWGVCSSDAGTPARKGKLTRRFEVPNDASYLDGRAFRVLAKGCEPDHRLDVVLVDGQKRLIPKHVKTSGGWEPVTGLLPRWQGEPRDYRWDLRNVRGQMLSLVVTDQDDRPGCYVYAGDFRIVDAAPATQSVVFSREMLELERKHKLTPLARYDSRRFTALSNASEPFTRQHLRYCEIFYDLFLSHFRQKGFAVQPPSDRLFIAMFDSPRGFEAYLGRQMPAGVLGIYHPPSNRLVLYDLKQNRSLLAARDERLRQAASSPFDRLHEAQTTERRYQDAARDFSLATTMHECAHQLSFNCGLLNRFGDRPVWLAEGLACYCEATNQGDWQSIGSPNPLRVAELQRVQGQYLRLEELLARDEWVGSQNVLLGYSQSWALFRMLMQQQPQALRRYLATQATRRTPDYRVADFREAFGRDLAAIDRDYRAYLDDLIVRYPPRAAR